MKSLPAALILLRFVLGILLWIDAADGHTNLWYVVGLVVALLSDYFDGVIARHLGVATTLPDKSRPKINLLFIKIVQYMALENKNEYLFVISNIFL